MPEPPDIEDNGYSMRESDRPVVPAHTGTSRLTDNHDQRERAIRILFWSLIFLSIAYVILKSYQLASGDTSLPAPEIDFVVFWAAAKLVLSGEAASAFDPGVLNAAAGYPPELAGAHRWFYPPGYAILVAPLGMLDFTTAWISFAVVSLACFAIAIHAPAARLTGGWRIMTVAPVMLISCLALGQNSALWAAALVAALWAMRSERPIAAGIWIAVLTLKPHLGIMVPVALVAARQWRIATWACLSSAFLAFVSTVPFGLAYWSEFFASLGTARSMMTNDGFAVERMVSFYGVARTFGTDHATAFWIYVPAAAIVTMAVAWIWRREKTSQDLKSAALCAAILLASPYAFYYDMVVLLVASVFLMRDGFGVRLAARIWLVVIWFGPTVSLYLCQSRRKIGQFSGEILAGLGAPCRECSRCS